MTQADKLINFPIDLVYLWVDGNDLAWRAKKREYSGEVVDAAVVNEARFRDNDELKYSLRSVEKFAPWVNRVFIVTDNQCPSWLDTSNPKVQIIDHSQIFPADALPIFNSTAIECVLHRIPGLSEHFIFANDDMLLSAPVSPLDFFNEDGTAVVRLSNRTLNRKKAQRKGVYAKMLVRMQDAILKKSGVLIPFSPHHNIDSYIKGVYEECFASFGEEWERTMYNRFRKDDDVHRSAVGYYMIATGRGTMRKVGRYNRLRGVWSKLRAFITNTFASDSRCVPVSARDYAKVMRKYNPLMFCMNDDENTTADDCKRMTEFLETLFPYKSSFEK